MRRADRLFQIVTFLQGRRRAVTARRLADEFGVCERTIYRDMQDLLLSGVPVTGEAGVGYMLDARYHLPPVMFTPEEVETLMLGISMVESWTDAGTGAIARRALAKIRGILNESGHRALSEAALLSAPSGSKVPWSVDFSVLRAAIHARRKLEITYADERGRQTTRAIRPLALVFFGPVWLLLAWCELRRDFRNFRIDRIGVLETMEEKFPDERGRRLVDYLAREGFADTRP